MPWQLTDDIAEYDAHASALLAQHPDEYTVGVTVLEDLKAGRKFGSEPPMLGWYVDGDGHVTGAVSMTPPYELLLTELSLDTVDELVDAVRTRGAEPCGVNGVPEIVEAFAKRWCGDAYKVHMRQRLYTLEQLKAPSPAPLGSARPARDGEVDLIDEWLVDFQIEAGAMRVRDLDIIRTRIAEQRMWFWEDLDGVVVSLAGHMQVVGGVARVGPVYTPPEYRRRGYGGAVTAAATQHALDEGAKQAVLFTDLSNPTSNAIYQQIGYRPVSDRMVVRFSG